MSNSSTTTEEAKEQAQHSSKPVEDSEEKTHYSFLPKRKQHVCLSSSKSPVKTLHMHCHKHCHNSPFPRSALNSAADDWTYLTNNIWIVMKYVDAIADSSEPLEQALLTCSDAICTSLDWPDQPFTQCATITTLCQNGDPTQYLYFFYSSQTTTPLTPPQYIDVEAYIYTILFP